MSAPFGIPKTRIFRKNPGFFKNCTISDLGCSTTLDPTVVMIVMYVHIKLVSRVARTINEFMRIRCYCTIVCV